jgi:hypothetical protein
MSTKSAPTNLEIVPPIILNEDADIVAYPSIEALVRDVELVDVLNGQYEFHDSTGRVLEARIDKQKIILTPTSKVEADSAELRGYIAQVLSLRGTVDGRLADASFGDLARLLLEKSAKHR